MLWLPRRGLDHEAHGHGWKLCRTNTVGIKPAVPPLYSMVMLPALIINSDPRVFYFVNVLLALGSVLFLNQILKHF